MVFLIWQRLKYYVNKTPLYTPRASCNNKHAFQYTINYCLGDGLILYYCNEPGYRYHNMDIKYIDFSQGLSVQITEVATQL